MKVKKCTCGNQAFIATLSNGLHHGMCKDDGMYAHLSGPSRKTKLFATIAWNKLIKERT